MRYEPFSRSITSRSSKAIDGALRVGRRAEPGTPHKFPRERLDGRSFAGEAFEELALIDGERFPQSRVSVVFALEQEPERVFDQLLTDRGSRFAQLPERVAKMLGIERMPLRQFTDGMDQAGVDLFAGGDKSFPDKRRPMFFRDRPERIMTTRAVERPRAIHEHFSIRCFRLPRKR